MLIKKIKLEKISFNEILYMLIYTMTLTSTMLGQITVLKAPLKIMSNLAIIIMLIKFIVQSTKYKKKTLLIMIFTLLIATISYIKSGEIVLIKLVLLVLESYGIEFKKIVKYDIKLKSILMLIVIIAYNLGMTNVFLKYRDDRHYTQFNGIFAS